jgi:hypothetical protein
MPPPEFCRIPQTIGSQISHDQYLFVVIAYEQRHPTEQKSVFIPKEYILETLSKFPDTTGLRFMYGQQAGTNPSSRTIVLMACDHNTADVHSPNLILLPKGYLTDTGERLTLDQCWDVLNRYVDRMRSLMPEVPRNDIPRATFFGITTMKRLLNEPGCAGIQFLFGYNFFTKIFFNEYETVMEAVDSNRQRLNVFVGDGTCCPTTCGEDCLTGIDLPIGWPFSGAYDGNEQVEDGTLFEMFHYVTPPLFMAIQDEQLYKTEFSECLALVDAGNLPKARQVLRKQLANMMEKYLFLFMGQASEP